MAMEHKPAGSYDSEAERVAQPAGFAYMAPPGQGSNQYGYWDHRDGRDFWVFYGQYALMRDLLFNHSYRPLDRYDWEGYRSSRDSGRTYYGRDEQAGAPTVRLAGHRHPGSLRRQQLRAERRFPRFAIRLEAAAIAIRRTPRPRRATQRGSQRAHVRLEPRPGAASPAAPGSGPLRGHPSGRPCAARAGRSGADTRGRQTSTTRRRGGAEYKQSRNLSARRKRRFVRLAPGDVAGGDDPIDAPVVFMEMAQPRAQAQRGAEFRGG